MPVNMGMYIPEQECRVPEGAQVVELKYCELCGKPFSRKQSTQQRLCYACSAQPRLETRAEELGEKQERYRVLLPAPRCIKPVNYRSSQRREGTNEARRDIAALFREKVRVRSDELARHVPNCTDLSTLRPYLKSLHIRVRTVELVRIPGKKGNGLAVYELESIDV